MKRIVIAALLVLAVPMVFAACGSDPTPEDEVRETAEQIIEAEEPEEREQVCSELLTQKFLSEVYADSPEQCAEKPINDDESIEDPGEVSVDSVTVDGPKATVEIITEGGDTDGNDGTWTMAEEDGQWKLNRLEDDFLRTTFLVSIENVDEGLIGYKPMNRCMSREVEDLDSKSLRRFLFLTIQEQESEALKAAIDIAKGCPRELSEFVADTLAEKVVGEQGGSPATVSCVKRELVPLLLVTGLAPQALRGGNEFGSATSAAFAGLISGVLKTCDK